HRQAWIDQPLYRSLLGSNQFRFKPKASRGFALAGIGLNHPGDLGRRGIEQAGHFGRGGLDQPDQLGSQLVQRRPRGQGLDAVGGQGGPPPRSTQDDEPFVRLGEVDGDLGRHHRVPRIGDQGRPLEQGRDRGDVRAIKSDLGEAVLRDLHRAARVPHLPTQILHLGNAEARIVSYDNDVRGLEGRIERRDELLLARSIHRILSRSAEPALLGRAIRLVAPAAPTLRKRGRDGASMPWPGWRLARPPVSARTDAGEPEPVSPVYAGPAGLRRKGIRHFDAALPPRCGPNLVASQANPRDGELSRLPRHLQSWTGRPRHRGPQPSARANPDETLRGSLAGTAYPPFGR